MLGLGLSYKFVTLLGRRGQGNRSDREVKRESERSKVVMGREGRTKGDRWCFLSIFSPLYLRIRTSILTACLVSAVGCEMTQLCMFTNNQFRKLGESFLSF